MPERTRQILRNRYATLAVGALCFAAIYLADLYRSGGYYHETQARSFEKALHAQEGKLTAAMQRLAGGIRDVRPDTLMMQAAEYGRDLYDRDGITLLAYANDSLFFWSNHAVPFDVLLSRMPFVRDGLVRLGNGWYESRSIGQQGRIIIGLLLLKNEYPHQNKYLWNDFPPAFEFPGATRVSHVPMGNYSDVRTDGGAFLLSLVPGRDLRDSMPFTLFTALLSIAGFLFVLVYLERECRLLSQSIGRAWAIVLLAVSLLLLRHLMMKTGFPSVLYLLSLFSPIHYAASAAFPSLGDFLINAALMLFLSVMVNRSAPQEHRAVRLGGNTKLVLASGALLSLYGYSWLVTNLVSGLVRHSSVPLNINNFFSLNGYSYAAFAGIGLLFFSFFLLADRAVIWGTAFLSDGITAYGRNLGRLTMRRMGYVFLAASATYVILCHAAGTLDVAVMTWPMLIVLFAGRLRRGTGYAYTFPNIIVFVLILSLFSAHLLSRHKWMRKKKTMAYLAMELADAPDHVAELLFSDMEKRLAADASVMDLIPAGTGENIALRDELMQRYFGGYWDKFHIEVTAFRPGERVTFRPDGSIGNRMADLERKINLEGSPVALCETLYRIKNPSTHAGYLARIEYAVDSLSRPGAGVTLYISFHPKAAPRSIGYPELLIDATNSEIRKREKMSSYSYAQYRQGKLTEYSGDFIYDLTDDVFAPAKEAPLLINGYHHTVRKSEDGLMVISAMQKSTLEYISFFSYLFIFLTLFGALLATLGLLPLRINLLGLNFKNRIQLYMILTLLLALTIVGSGTIVYINRQYNTANYQNIRERLQSVLIEVEHKLGSRAVLTPDMEPYITYILQKFSNVFFTDINLYDPEGDLIASSRPGVFEQELMAKKMHTKAFAEMAVKNRVEFVHEERVGELYYFSAYAPFRNTDNQLLAYLHLPYFAKKSEMEQSIQTFMSTLINIYGLLIVLTTMAALFLSNRVTKPLQLIQEKLSKIKLGRSNETIEWKSKDEIGSLVNEYNRMIGELAKSVEKLQRSERESAWREMARQVAHEIKNPLTPMKLSIQHLERSWQDDPAGREQKIRNFTRSMIEQIDALSSIATEFSNFAKMPRPKNEVVDLRRLLENTTGLYEDAEHTAVSFQAEAPGEALVYADKDQLLRVFNNLLRNAIQAIPGGRKGRVDVRLVRDGNRFTVSVSDNGTGIAAGRVEKIFVPNFTTKTGGMGLGLAMVRSIVEGIGGKVWFETGEGEGTTFYVALNVHPA